METIAAAAEALRTQPRRRTDSVFRRVQQKLEYANAEPLAYGEEVKLEGELDRLEQSDPRTTQQVVDDFAAQLDRIAAGQRFRIHPEGRFMSHWDILLLFALLFTATVTPYEVSGLAQHRRIQTHTNFDYVS